MPTWSPPRLPYRGFCSSSYVAHADGRHKLGSDSPGQVPGQTHDLQQPGGGGGRARTGRSVSGTIARVAQEQFRGVDRRMQRRGSSTRGGAWSSTITATTRPRSPPRWRQSAKDSARRTIRRLPAPPLLPHAGACSRSSGGAFFLADRRDRHRRSTPAGEATDRRHRWSGRWHDALVRHGHPVAIFEHDVEPQGDRPPLLRRRRFAKGDIVLTLGAGDVFRKIGDERWSVPRGTTAAAVSAAKKKAADEVAAYPNRRR